MSLRPCHWTWPSLSRSPGASVASAMPAIEFSRCAKSEDFRSTGWQEKFSNPLTNAEGQGEAQQVKHHPTHLDQFKDRFKLRSNVNKACGMQKVSEIASWLLVTNQDQPMPLFGGIWLRPNLDGLLLPQTLSYLPYFPFSAPGSSLLLR